MDDVSSVEDHLMVYNRKSLYYVMIGLLLSVHIDVLSETLPMPSKFKRKGKLERKQFPKKILAGVHASCFRHQYSTFKKASPKTCLLTLFFERYLNR